MYQTALEQMTKEQHSLPFLDQTGKTEDGIQTPRKDHWENDVITTCILLMIILRQRVVLVQRPRPHTLGFSSWQSGSRLSAKNSYYKNNLNDIQG